MSTTAKKKCIHCPAQATTAALEPGKGDTPVAHLCDEHRKHKKWNWNLVPLDPPEPPAPKEKKPRASKASPAPTPEAAS